MGARATSTNRPPRRAATGETDAPPSLNAIELTGRVSGDPESKELPSGDVVMTMRLVVPRPAGGPVDTIDLACWSKAARRAGARVADGQHVHVTGALRRRFFRTPGGAASRYEVEVTSLKRLPVSG